MSKVYFIQEGDSGPIKIGCSKDLDMRLRVMRGDNSRKLTLLCSIGGDENEVKWLHREFEELHIQGKWYIAGERLIKAIETIKEGNPAGFKLLVEKDRLESYKRERKRNDNVYLTR